MPQPRDFDQFAERFGGALNVEETLGAEGGTEWLPKILLGLESLVARFHGNVNARGDVYRVRHGLFNFMEINGVADRAKTSLVFGISLGAVLRLTLINRLLCEPTSYLDEESLLDYLMAGDPGSAGPENTGELLSKPVPKPVVPIWQDRTFFSVGFVFMHEAFHTLIGHADLVRSSLQFGLDELNLDRETGEKHDLIQAMELEADGAAFSNFWLTLRQRPRFGLCRAARPDPAERIAEATFAGLLALLAFEARRAHREEAPESTHPFPSRRVASVVGFLRTYERRGVLPKGCRERLGEKARAVRPVVQDMAIAPLVDLIAEDAEVAAEDRERLVELIALYKEELRVFEDLSYAPRVSLETGLT